MIAASDAGLAYVSFQGLQDFKALILDKANIPSTQALELAHAAGRQIQEYFDHKRKVFDLPLDMENLPDFRRRVLLETARIPFGEAISYGELAGRIQQPKAARAVGGALARNPLVIVVPCHRVVARDGSMHGFFGRRGHRNQDRAAAVGRLPHPGRQTGALKNRFSEEPEVLYN